MTPLLPKLRSDLILSEQDTDQGKIFIVKDPCNDSFFQLRDSDYFIASQFDGETPIDTVRARVEKEYDASLSPEALAGFLKTLKKRQLLEREDGSPVPHKKQKRFNGNLLYCRFKLYNPERLFNWLIHRTRFFFTPQFVAFSAFLICVSGSITIMNWNAVVQDASQLYSLSTLPLVVVSLFVLFTLHEFGHGLTCRHFGGEVKEMGFLLMYFQPGFYCNVSDAWLFPQKSRRLWVGFAGPYFELFIWALATLMWRATESGTLVNQIALVSMGISGFTTMLNCNPLIKLDGYYILSDWLEIPNLRKKSFAYMGALIGSSKEKRALRASVTPRERRVFLLYGLTAWIFSFSLLAYTSLLIGEFLVIEKQRVAFLAFGALVGFRFKGKLGKVFQVSSTKSKKKSKSKSKKKDTVTIGQRIYRLFKFTLKLGVVAGLITLLFVVRMELRISGPITALPQHNADIRTEVDGMIEEILVDEGELVEEGDVIALLHDRELEAELYLTKARIAENQARLDILEAGTRPELIDLGRYAVTRAEKQYQFAEEQVERDRQLYEDKMLSITAYEANRKTLATATSDLAAARKNLELLKIGPRPEEIDAMRASVSSFQAQEENIEKRLALMRVISPTTGLVTTPSRQLKAMENRFISKGSLIAKIHNVQTITAEIALSEKEIADVVIGQKVLLKVRTYPSMLFHGEVINIATTVQGATLAMPVIGEAMDVASTDVTSTAKTILVMTQVDNQDGLLKPGMTGMAKVYCGEYRLIDLILRRLSHTLRVEFWSWW